jgi:hypothetical protein
MSGYHIITVKLIMAYDDVILYEIMPICCKMADGALMKHKQVGWI